MNPEERDIEFRLRLKWFNHVSVWLGCVFVWSCAESELKTRRTLREVRSSFWGESPKITSVYRGSATMRQCSGQRWASPLFLFHLWSKHFTLWHTPMFSVTPKMQYILHPKVDMALSLTKNSRTVFSWTEYAWPVGSSEEKETGAAVMVREALKVHL